MSIIKSSLKVLELGFGIIGTKQARKYQKEALELKRIYAVESNKSKATRSNAVMDNVRMQYGILVDVFTDLAKPKS